MKSKPLAILASFVIAFTLWLYVTSVVTPEWSETYRGVPVVLDGENILTERGLMLMMEYTPTARVKLEGNRSDLVNINEKNLTLIADLTRITEPGEYYLSYEVDVASNITVLQQEPDRVAVVVAERQSKPVPVQINYEGTLPEGYIMDKGNEILDYTEVTVSGPREVVEQIHHASITVNCDDRTETVVESSRYVLCNEAGEAVDAAWITTNTEQVRLEVKVSRVKKVPLVLTVNAGGGATEDNSMIVIDPAEISVSGSDAALEKLTELNLGTINLAEILKDTQKDFQIVMPEGITNVSGVTTAKVSISFPDLSKREFTITSFKTENVSEGMEAELLTKQLTVTVRGPKAQVDSLKTEHIIVMLDLTGVVNTDTVVPSITFADGYEDVGVVGKYTVSVTVDEPEPTEPTQE